MPTRPDGSSMPGGGICFQLGDRDVGPLLRDRLGLSWNRLSAFADPLAAYTPGSGEASAEALALARHPRFGKTAAILARPEVRIGHRCGGPTLAAFAAYGRRDAHDAVAVVFPMGDGAHLIRLFDSSAAYFAWWLKIASSGADELRTDDSVFTLPLEALLCWLHAVDMYRRAKYQQTLSGAPAGELFIPVAQFVDAMAQAVQRRDTRWLLPTFLLLAQGLAAFNLEPRASDLKMLADRGFLIPGKNPQNDEHIFVYGEALKSVGDEFTADVDAPMGLQIAVWTKHGALPVFDAFLVPTRAANHLIEIEPGPDGTGLATHRALTQRALYARMVGLLSAALEPPAAQVAMKQAMLRRRAHVQVQEQARVCPVCSHRLRAGAKFCAACGAGVDSHGPRPQRPNLYPRAIP